MERESAAKVFAHLLGKHLEQRGLSVRAFGRMVDPDDPERGRRRVQRHLSGRVIPSIAARDAYVATLEIDPSELPLPSDEDGQDVEAAFAAVTREYRALGNRLGHLGRVLQGVGS